MAALELLEAGAASIYRLHEEVERFDGTVRGTGLVVGEDLGPLPREGASDYYAPLARLIPLAIQS